MMVLTYKTLNVGTGLILKSVGEEEPNSNDGS